ncbi:MAG: DHH family phosphoesterase [Chlamydiia bacterium]|nr:DHH family phosphoesterase [Chlamydiia bacterium]
MNVYHILIATCFGFFTSCAAADAGDCKEFAVSSYLREVRSRYDTFINEAKSSPVHIVMGNEAADLDSISAAVARAKHLSLKSTNSEDLFLPVINISREELPLRRDAEFLFTLLNINSESLLFTDDIPFDSLAANGQLKLHLVDHNALAVHQLHFREQVVSIIDHHADEKMDYPNCLENDKVVASVGSATSLVASNLLTDCYAELDSSWARLMLAPILLDTLNLQSSSRTTQLDLDVAQRLLDLSKFDKFASNAFYENLLKARSDTDGFTPDMLMRKDMKRYQEGLCAYTISSLPYGIKFEWYRDSNLQAILQGFRTKQAVPIVMIIELSAENTGDQYRRLHVHCESPEILEHLLQYFTENAAISDLVSLERADLSALTATWVLPNFVSRKLLQPKLKLGELFAN